MPYGPNGTRCRVCGCTYERACGDGCSWVRDLDLCSTCYAAAEAVSRWMRHARRPSFAALKREALNFLETQRAIRKTGMKAAAKMTALRETIASDERVVKREIERF